MRRKKGENEGGKRRKTPGPPPRPKKAKVRAERRIWLTLVGRGGRSWDSWIADPTGTGIKVTPPWSEKEENFYVGESEGAYDISFDEEHEVRRLTVYEGMPKAPVYIQKGAWKETADMTAETQTFINNLELERAAEIQEAGDVFPRWGLAVIAMAAMTAAVAIVGFVTR